MDSKPIQPSYSRALGWRSGPLVGAILLGALVSCTAENAPVPGAGDDVVVGTGGAGPGGTGGTVGTGGSGAAAADCSGRVPVASTRLVRLSFNQVANSIATLVDAALGTSLVEQFEIVDAQHRAFPPLQSAREGNSFTDDSWGAVDMIAQTAGQYAFDHLGEVTQCGAEPTDDCALTYLLALARKAYRHPLDDGERERLTALYTTAFRGAGASVSEAIQYGVYAIFQAPQFLYRTEFADAAGDLTQLEKAALLSYFLTDNTPDETLLGAAERGELGTPEALGAQVDRILLEEATKVNLKGAMMSYFAYPNLETQVIQDDAFTGDMRRSMYHEAELFLDKVLWSQPLNDLLISKKGYVDQTLAPLYGLSQFPPSGAVPLADSFYEITLPETRTGLLTQAAFLANRSRPDHTSVVGRGLLIKGAFLCTETPPPSAEITEIITNLTATMPDASEREMAELRAQTISCAGCHSTFDAYGLALDTFDVLGRYREVDDAGRPIDPHVTLPVAIGGGDAANIVEVATRLADSGAFARCMGQNLVNYALADVSAGSARIESCAVERLAETFAKTDGTFPALVKTVALSEALTQRTIAGAP